METSRQTRSRLGRIALAAIGVAALSGCGSPPPPPSHPAGDLYLTPPVKPRPVPSTDNDPNGGAI